MLSVSKGLPIAKIIGGAHNGEFVHIHTEERKPKQICCKRHNKRCLKRGCCEYCPFYYEEDNGSEEDDIGKEVKINDGIIEQIPNLETRECCYYAGPSGAGKSTLMAKYAKKYIKLFPDKEVYLFSNKDKDPVFDEIKPPIIRFPVNESLIDNPIDVNKELKQGGLIIFDDCNTFTDKKLKKAISGLMNQILEIGRSLGIYCLISSHLINQANREDNKTIFNEAHTVTLFCKTGNKYSRDYALQKYLGFGKKEINKIVNLPSRWVTIGKNYPEYVIHEKGVYAT
jgi:hypothetical protein